MIATTFPEANSNFRRPTDMTAEQCVSIPTYKGVVESGSCAGHKLVVVAWKPTPEELEVIVAGGPIFLSVLGGLPPHFLTACFAHATNPV
jgi:hypothetical protein